MSVFDIVGPVMIGPSSSHTAGAARLGKLAKEIAEEQITEVEFLLHGSFAETYKGHGTDRALVAGILGFEPWDDRLIDSLSIANKKNIAIKFTKADLGDVHPNTVRFIIKMVDNKTIEIQGSSIGGGNVKITKIGYQNVDFNGDYPTLIIEHIDEAGVVSKVTEILYQYNINIAFMRVFRSKKGEKATMILEIDNPLSDEIVDEIKKVDNIQNVRFLS